MAESINRLQLADKDVIITFFRAQGFVIQTKIRPPVVYLWFKDRFMGSLAWRKKLGWVPSFTGPAVHSHDDFPQIVQELKNSYEVFDNVEITWEEFHKSPSLKRRQVYQGHQASYYCRMASTGKEADRTEALKQAARNAAKVLGHLYNVIEEIKKHHSGLDKERFETDQACTELAKALEAFDPQG